MSNPRPYDIFISHSSSDHPKIGEKLREFLEYALFDGQTGRIYYTAEPGAIPFDCDYDDILIALEGSKAIVAIATKDALAKTSVIAEMALAFYAKKLYPLVPHFTGTGVLAWPFDHQQACFLHRPANIRQLVVELRRRLGLPAELPPDIDERCATLSAASVAAYPPPPPPPPLWKSLLPAAAAALPVLLILCGLCYWLGQQNSEIKYYPLIPRKPIQIGSTRVSLVYSGTMPARYLGLRLREFHERRLDYFNKAPAGARPAQPPLEAETIAFFQEALSGPAKAFDELSLHNLAAATLPLPAAPKSSIPCAAMTPAGKAWCEFFEDLKNKKDPRRDKFDNTSFALLLLHSASEPASPLVITNRSVPEIGGQKVEVYAMARMSSLEDNSTQDDQSGIVVLKDTK